MRRREREDQSIPVHLQYLLRMQTQREKAYEITSGYVKQTDSRYRGTREGGTPDIINQIVPLSVLCQDLQERATRFFVEHCPLSVYLLPIRHYLTHSRFMGQHLLNLSSHIPNKLGYYDVTN